MYNITKDCLYSFINDDANVFLLTYFADNDGLGETKSRPTCRKNALTNLIKYGQ